MSQCLCGDGGGRPWKLYLLMVPPTQPIANCPPEGASDPFICATTPSPEGGWLHPGRVTVLRLSQLKVTESQDNESWQVRL